VLLIRAPERPLLLTLGLFILCYAAWGLASRGGPPRLARGWCVPIGLAGGAFSALFGTGGVLFAIYNAGRLRDATELRANNAAMILLSSLLRLVLFGAVGLLGQEGLPATALMLAPALALGFWAGGRLHASVPPVVVVKAVYALLVNRRTDAARAFPLMALAPRQWLPFALAATLLFRFWLSAVAPVTADEAYFILWGRSPDLGYYDHPPMVGWLLAPLAALGDAAWLLRLPALLVPPLVALMVRWALRGRLAGEKAGDADTADLAALAVLLMPVNVWNVLITTDTPLVLFSVAALLVFARAAETDSKRLFLASGILLGLAFLSKYFAVLLGLAFLIWAIVSKKPGAFLLVFSRRPAVRPAEPVLELRGLLVQRDVQTPSTGTRATAAAGRSRRRACMPPHSPTWPRRCCGSRGAGATGCAKPGGGGRASARCCSPGWCRWRCSPCSAP